jgi:hypothetical protein
MIIPSFSMRSIYSATILHHFIKHQELLIVFKSGRIDAGSNTHTP